MSEKSHVSMEQRVCLVCDKRYETNAVLLDKRLRPTLERFTTTGYGLCPEHSKEGYVCLIEVDPGKSDGNGGRMKPENAHRTGGVAWVKEEAFRNIFNAEVAPICYVTIGVLEKLEAMRQSANKEEG